MGVCEERVHCFVHGQAEQQFLLCVHLSPLSILLRLCMQNATSDSLMAFTLIPFPVIILLIHFRFLLSLIVIFDVISDQ